MSALLDAKDELARGRDLIELIAMAVRKSPDSDESAIGTDCHAALQHIESCEALISSHIEKAAQVGDSPIAALHREIVRRNAFLKADHGLSEDEFEAHNMETVALADQIADLPALNIDDMLRKIMGYCFNGDHDLRDGPRGKDIWAEACALVGGAA